MSDLEKTDDVEHIEENVLPEESEAKEEKKKNKSVSANDFFKKNRSTAFVSQKTVKKTITWKDAEGEETDFDVFVRKHSFSVFSKLIQKQDGDDPSIANIVCTSLAKSENSKEDLLSYQEACSLDAGLGLALLNAVNDVNSPTPKENTKKN